MFKTVREKIIPGIVLAFVGSAISFGFTWFQNYYNQPRIVVDTTRNYSNFNGNLIGNVTVINVGNRADEDVVVNVYSKLNKGEVKTDGASIDNKVEIGVDETKFIISKLNPNDTAVISFSSLDKEVTTFDVAANSQSNKIEETIIAPHWWEINITQMLFIATLAFFILLIGVYLGKPIKTVRSRKK